MDQKQPEFLNLDHFIEDKKYHTTEDFFSELDIAQQNKDLFYYVDDDDKWKVLIPEGLFTLGSEPTRAQMLIVIHNVGPIIVPFIGPYQLQILYQTPDGLECFSQDPTLMIPILLKGGKVLETLKTKHENDDDEQAFLSYVQSVLQMLMTVQAVSDAENSRLAHKVATHLSRNPKNKLPSTGPLWNSFLSRLSSEIKNVARHILKGLIPDTPSNFPAISTSAIDDLSIEQAGTFTRFENGKSVAWFNERAARYIENHFALQGKRLADHIRNLENSFDIWTTKKKESPCEPWLINLGKVIWLDEFEEMRARLERKPGPAVPHPLAEKYAIIAQQGNSIGKSRDGALVLLDANKDPICCLMDPLNGAPLKNAASIIDVLEDGAKLLNSVYAIKILLMMVSKVWEQWIEGNNQIINVIVIHGGWSGFCKLLGAVDKTGKALPKTRTEIKKIMEVFRHGDFHIPSINSKGPLLTFREPIKSPLNPEDKRQKDLIITVSDPLLPDSIDALQGKTHTDRTSRRLVPFPPLPPAPDKLSKDKHAAHARLYIRTLLMLRERASQFAKQGWVKISDEDWHRIASASGLQQSDLKTVLDHWTKTIAWLQRRGEEHEDQYCVASVDRYAFAQEMLADAGRREVEGSINGLSGVAKRQQRRTKRPKKTNQEL